ncbi:hypothetical protein CFOL_v3_36279, partial [Cephalotus follicularis]
YQNAYRDVQQSNFPPSAPMANEDKLDKVLIALDGINKNTQKYDQIIHSHTQSISKLETQIGQLADMMRKREESHLPSQVVKNPRNQAGQCSYVEQAQAITTLRSGRVIEEPQVTISNPD